MEVKFRAAKIHGFFVFWPVLRLTWPVSPWKFSDETGLDRITYWRSIAIEFDWLFYGIGFRFGWRVKKWEKGSSK